MPSQHYALYGILLLHCRVSSLAMFHFSLFGLFCVDGDTPGANSVYGAISGATSKLLVYPLDTGKKLLQVYQQVGSDVSPRSLSLDGCSWPLRRRHGGDAEEWAEFGSVVRLLHSSQDVFELLLFVKQTPTSSDSCINPEHFMWGARTCCHSPARCLR